MRKYFSSLIMKQYFQAAWFCLPKNTQNDLYKFIRQIREVEYLKDTYIGCPDGSRYGPLDEGNGFTLFYKDDDIAFCDIILSSDLVEASPALAIGTILHELAHALDYFICPENVVNSIKINAEVNAWDKAISWSKEGIPDPALARDIEYSALYAEIRLGLDEFYELTKARIESEGL